MLKQDTFLADELGRNRPKAHLTFMDGFRFGVGSIVAILLVSLLTGAIAWSMILVFKLK
jgi:hypothetical protein